MVDDNKIDNRSGNSEQFPGKSRDMVLDFYRDAIHDQHGKVKILKKALQIYVMSIESMTTALDTLHAATLTMYNKSWPFRQDIEVCFEDEKTVWDNYSQDVHEVVMTVFQKYIASLEMTEMRSDEQEEVNSEFHSLKTTLKSLQKDRKSSPKQRHQAERKCDEADKNCQAGQEVLLRELPKVIASQVQFLNEFSGAMAKQTNAFISELSQVKQATALQFTKLLNSNPTVVVGKGKDRIKLSIHNTIEKPLPKSNETPGKNTLVVSKN